MIAFVLRSLSRQNWSKEGLEVHAWLDEKEYKKAKIVSNTQLAEVRIHRDSFHGEWNYQIIPNAK